MKFFNNRFVAVCILLVGMVISTFSGVESQLTEKVNACESQLYYSDTGSKAIFQRLEDRCDAASNLVSIAYNYPNIVTETEELRFAQTEMYDGLYYGGDISAMFDANENLEPAFQALYQALIEEDLSEDDFRAVESYVTTFNGAQRMIDEDETDYNTSVQNFIHSTMNAFPARIFVDLLDIDEPEFFRSDRDNVDSTIEIPLQGTAVDHGVSNEQELENVVEDFEEGLENYIERTIQDAFNS